MIHINRARDHNRLLRMAVRNWKEALFGYPCFLIGNGPSVCDHDIHLLDNYFTIGVNRAYAKFGFDPTILFWQDANFWSQEKQNVRKLKAIKYARDAADPERIAYHFKLRGGPFVLSSNPQILYGSGASGPLAFQLAVCLKCDPIILLGYDCCYRKELTDFYGINEDHKPHTLTRCRAGLKWMHVWDEKKVLRFINCSDSDIFGPKITLPDAIEMVKTMCKDDRGLPKGREFYYHKLSTNIAKN